MCAASLELLNNELFEQIVRQLNIDDIRSLRLASRSTAYKANQDTYRAFFRNKDVDLTRAHLEDFVELTSQDGLGCLLEELSLNRVIYNTKDLQVFIETDGRTRPQWRRLARKARTICTDEELDAARQDLALLQRRPEEDEAFRAKGRDVVLLRKAFANIASSKRGPLKRLSLSVRTHRGEMFSNFRTPLPFRDPSQSILQVAASTFRLIMDSLCYSQLKVEDLEIFCDWPRSLQSSLPSVTIANLEVATDRLGACFSCLKVLSLSITDQMYEDTDCTGRNDDVAGPAWMPGDAPSRASMANVKNYAALSELLRLCPSLEKLSVVGYLPQSSNEELRQHHKTMRDLFLHHLALAQPLSRLRKLRLVNLEAQDVDLVAFLRAHSSSLRELDLIDFRITRGSFTTLVSYITSDETDIERICFEEICEPDGVIHFRCDWELERMDDFGRDFVKRSGLSRKRDMSYYSKPLGTIGIAKRWEWTLQEQP